MKHHDSALIELALGQGQSAVDDAELAASAEMRAELAAIEETLGALAYDAAPLEPSAALRDRLLASIAPDASPWEGFVDRLSQLYDLGAERVREILRSPKSAWIEGAFPNTALLHFRGGPRVASADCGLIRLDPGASFPHHSHTGDEWGIVLSGQAREDSGVLWEVGDLLHNEPGSEHTFEALGQEPFVLAVVVEAPIRLTGKNTGD